MLRNVSQMSTFPNNWHHSKIVNKWQQNVNNLQKGFFLMNKSHKAAFDRQGAALLHALCSCVGEQSMCQRQPCALGIKCRRYVFDTYDFMGELATLIYQGGPICVSREKTAVWLCLLSHKLIRTTALPCSTGSFQPKSIRD
jgi:hypothetical protein